MREIEGEIFGSTVVYLHSYSQREHYTAYMPKFLHHNHAKVICSTILRNNRSTSADQSASTAKRTLQLGRKAEKAMLMRMPSHSVVALFVYILDMNLPITTYI